MVAGTVLPLSHYACITVDHWRRNVAQNVVAAFLTHAHADHLQGLTDTWDGKGCPPLIQHAGKTLQLEKVRHELSVHSL